MKPFAKLDSQMTERNRYTKAIWKAWTRGKLTGFGVGVAGEMLIKPFDRLLRLAVHPAQTLPPGD